MSKILYKYRVYCEIDSQYEITNYIDSEDGPATVCPVNNNHTITSSLTTVVETVTTAPLTREDGIIYSIPKPSSYGLEMCDRDFKLSTSIFDPASATEDYKLNTTTLLEEPWGELNLVGVYKNSAGSMVPCVDQTDANTNCVLSVWEYYAVSQVDGVTPIQYELKDGYLYVDHSLAANWNNPTAEEKYGHRIYGIVAPEIPPASGGSIAIFDAYLGGIANKVIAATSPQATILNPNGPAGLAGAKLRLYIYHPAGSKLSHILRLVTYRAKGTY